MSFLALTICKNMNPSAQTPRYLGNILSCVLIVLSIIAAVKSQEPAGTSGWHENDAGLRFRIEKDYSHSLVPDVSLLDIPPDKKSKNGVMLQVMDSAKAAGATEVSISTEDL